MARGTPLNNSKRMVDFVNECWTKREGKKDLARFAPSTKKPRLAAQGKGREDGRPPLMNALSKKKGKGAIAAHLREND